MDIKKVNNRDAALTLNVLLTKRCSANCLFCVEKTRDKSYAQDANLNKFVEYINMLDMNNLITETLLLGGEPFDYPYLLEIIRKISPKSIITTNALKLAKIPCLLYKLGELKDKLNALNISVCHYDFAK